jgi:hypothetical protein
MIYLLLFIYIAIIFIECVAETFFDDAPLTPHFVRMSFIWPLRISLFFTMAVINLFNCCFAGICLCFGFYYSNTKVYEFIDELTLKFY